MLFQIGYGAAGPDETFARAPFVICGRFRFLIGYHSPLSIDGFRLALGDDPLPRKTMVLGLAVSSYGYLRVL